MAYENIFSQYLKPAKSVMDYNAEFDEAAGRKQAMQANALTLAANQQKFNESQQSTQRQAQLRQAMMGLSADATDEDRVKVMRGTASPEGFAAADALEKSLVERKKGLAAANKDVADTSHKNLTREIALHDFHAQKLAQVQTPEQALAWAQEGNALGLFNQPGQYERGVASIQAASQSPEAFAQWRQGALQGGQSATDQLKAQAVAAKQAEEVRQFGVKETRIVNENTKDRSVQMRGQNMTDARAKEANGIGGAGPDASPATVDMIGQGKMAPPTGYALKNPQIVRMMEEVAKKYPDFDATEYAGKVKAMRDFTTGTAGNSIRSFAVATDHLKQLDGLVDALENGNTPLINKYSNKVAQATGSDAPTNFDAAKGIVAKEVLKSIVAGGGGVEERQELAHLLDNAKTGKQLKGVIKTYMHLMEAQKDGLEKQYELSTGRKDSKTRFAYGEKEDAPTSAPAAKAAPGAKPSLDDIFGKKK